MRKGLCGDFFKTYIMESKLATVYFSLQFKLKPNPVITKDKHPM